MQGLCFIGNCNIKAWVLTCAQFGAGCLNTSCRFQHDVKPGTLLFFIIYLFSIICDFIRFIYFLPKGPDSSMMDAEDTSDISASLPKTPPQVTV